MGMLSTLKRVFLDSEDIELTSNMENADLSDELRKSLETIDNITSIEEARQKSAVNYGGKSKSSVKETSRVKSTGRTSRKTPVKEVIEENKEIDDGLDR
jgi:hypothetical protein